MSVLEEIGSSNLRQRVLSSEPRQKAIRRALRACGRKRAAIIYRRMIAFGCNITHAVSEIESRSKFDESVRGAWYHHLADAIEGFSDDRGTQAIECATAGILLSLIDFAARAEGKSPDQVAQWLHPIEREFIELWGSDGGD